MTFHTVDPCQKAVFAFFDHDHLGYAKPVPKDHLRDESCTTLAKKIETATQAKHRRVHAREITCLCHLHAVVSIFLARVVAYQNTRAKHSWVKLYAHIPVDWSGGPLNRLHVYCGTGLFFFIIQNLRWPQPTREKRIVDWCW